MDGRCQCGTVTFQTPIPNPLEIYICHCNECRHQSSSAFGLTAIFPTFSITPPYKDAIGIYSRQTASGRKLDCYFCTKCGSRLMHKCDADETLSVKAGCLEGISLKGAKHIWCKEAVIEIPPGVERYDEEPPGGSLSNPELSSKEHDAPKGNTFVTR